MLNSAGERELCYIVTVDTISSITGYDRVELAHVGGWAVIVKKDQFKPGDPGIYFEIDSKVPSNKECFAFLEKRNYKIKTLKMCKVVSQGLLMSAEDFGWHVAPALNIEGYNTPYIIDNEGHSHNVENESRFLTKQLGVTYADEEDNQRKAPSIDKYKKMAQRHPKIFKKPIVRWLMKYKCGRKIMFLLFGRKGDKKNNWPAWVKKTDEERIENQIWTLKDKSPWIVTEKCDGSSTTFTMRRGRFNKKEFYVCSRNVCFGNENKKQCYYDSNIYLEMAEKYHMFEVLSQFLKETPSAKWVTIQGETYGEGVQRNTYGLKGHDFMAFNLITSDKGRWNSCEMKKLLEEKYNVPCVPILNEAYILPDSVEELREYVNSQPSVINGELKEGIVCRSLDGVKSFKCVSPEYLMKYHS